MRRATDAVIEEIRPENATTSLVELRVPALGPGAVRPGAVASVSVPGAGESYFALASSPDDFPVADVLVRHGPPVAEALLSMSPGEHARVRGPVGPGFDVDRLRGRSVALIGVGSAIAPLRSALLYMLARREQFRRIAVVYGVRDPADFCFTEELPSWTEQGVEPHLVVSRPGEADWAGRRGRVQLHLDEALPDWKGGAALVCGMPAMMEETVVALEELGVSREDVLRNF